MMEFLRHLLGDRIPKEQTSDLIHAMRNQAQVAELERHVMQRRREKRERQDLADALAHTRPPWRNGENRP